MLDAHRSISAHAEEPGTVRTYRSYRRVYLRARGGTAFLSECPLRQQGLSPRTRRNQQKKSQGTWGTRSISAHAEEPAALGARKRSVKGLSPRTRRNPVLERNVAIQVGSISAHAEEPRSHDTRPDRPEVYLRARGGTLHMEREINYHDGLSPRTRRNPLLSARQVRKLGSISAHAEEPG
ncbi:Hypothetical protein GbCGDNIH5_8162 [Granulibacter bethesdensis]|nr:Hypothetical protein GbCGDNIH5_8162 [Granulibacter bethesdensis]